MFTNQKAKLTTPLVKEAKFPAAGDYSILDTELSGFQLRVSKSAKTWIVRKTINKIPYRHTIGHFPAMEITEARKLAREAIVMFESGKHPTIEKEKKSAETTKHHLENQYLFKDAWEEYRKGDFSESTKADHDAAERKLADHKIWQTPFSKITEELVIETFEAASIPVSKRAIDGKTAGANIMKYLQAAAQKAIDKKYKDGRVNIIKTVMDDGRRPKKRAKSNSLLKENGALKKWWDAVEFRRTMTKEAHHTRTNNTFADYFILVIFSGGRKTECTKIEWRDLDFEIDTVTFRKEITKNGEEHVFPMTPYLKEILLRRFNDPKRHKTYVFQSRQKRAGHDEITHIVSPENQIKKLRKISGIDFSTHDLRRTFTNLMSDNASLDIVKAALNHTPSNVTEKHYRDKLRQLRKHYLEYEDHILAEVGVRKRVEKKGDSVIFKGQELNSDDIQELLAAIKLLKKVEKRG